MDHLCNESIHAKVATLMPFNNLFCYKQGQQNFVANVISITTST